MKSRIKIDSAILSFIIILTGLLYWFPQLYSLNRGIDNVLDFLGLIVVLSGNFLRMASRGHKKAHSMQGQGLVKTGPYALVRNPMYLGSFMMGCGFVLIVWPWWSLTVFGVLFYLRFRRQVKNEERHLRDIFGASFETYVQKVPLAYPRLADLKKAKMSEVFPPGEIWDTKERRGVFTWPLLAVILETFQEKIVFGFTNLGQTISIFFLAGLAFACVVRFLYHYKKIN